MILSATAIRTKVFTREFSAQAVTVLVGAAVLAVSSRLSVLVGPVPITAQTLALLLIAGLLGPVRGGCSVAAYLLAGVAGLPVYATAAGALSLFGPTGGYLLGFLPAVVLAGWMMSKVGRNVWLLAGCCLAGLAVLYSCGLLWLRLYVPADKVLAAGFWPFLPGEAVKIAIAAVVLRLNR